MDQNTMLMLGLVKLQNSHTKQIEAFDARGFDVLGFFFPFLRYAIAGMWGKAFLTFVVSCTIIGYPIMCWVTGFGFHRARLQHLLRNGWTIVQDTPAKVTQPEVATAKVA